MGWGRRVCLCFWRWLIYKSLKLKISELGGLFGNDCKLTYPITWPLDLVFTDLDMEIYNKLFKFLLALKSTQERLISLWKSLKRSDVKKWNAMNHFLNCFVGYVQVIFFFSKNVYLLKDGYNRNIILKLGIPNWK